MKTMRAFIAGVIVTAMLLSVVAVSADVQTIEAFFNNIKISINGESIELKDANGNPVEPLIYNGTTYLPVRAIAGAFGMETKYNETTSTIELTSAKGVGTLTENVKTVPETIDDYKTVTEDGMTIQLRPGGIKYIYPGSLSGHIFKNAKEYLVKWNDKYPELSRASGVAAEIDINNATVDFILKRYDGDKITLMENVPTNNDCGTFLIPYDEYMNNILPQLVELIKRNSN